MRLRPILLFAAGALPLLGGCVRTGQPGPAADLSCPAQRTEFDAAVVALPAPPAASGEAYWARLRQTSADTDAAARLLAGDLAALATATGRIDAGYGVLVACRRDHAEMVRTQIGDGTLTPPLGAQRLAEERQLFEAELARGREAAGQIGIRQVILQEAAERLVAENPRNAAKVARAVAASPVPATPYMVKENAEIFARPDPGGARIADLRKGQRVQGPGDGPAPGWITLTLNDGSLGYVDAGVLRQIQPNASALEPTARAKALREIDGDPIVGLALAARETLPARAQGFASMLESAALAATTAFAAEPAPAPRAAALAQ